MARFFRASETPTEPEAETPASGKGRATPSRRAREAANRRPLVPSDRKAAGRESRTQAASARERARVGMMNGEERYLSARDRGPQKRFVRDWMDARWSLGELVLPLAVVVLVGTALPPSIGTWILYAVWAFFLVCILDFVILGHRLTKRLRGKYGDRTERIRFYLAMRGIYPRFMRAPRPQVKRGQYPSL